MVVSGKYREMKPDLAVVAPHGDLMEDQPEVTTILLTDVLIDRANYQRAPETNHIRRLRDDWDALAANLLTVNLRVDGIIALIDGQHRLLAMREMGISHWRAFAYTGLSVQHEAQLFLQLNRDRRHHRPVESWRAELTAGDPTTLAVDAAVRSCGFTIGKMSKTKNLRTISCPATLRKIASANLINADPERVRRLLVFLDETWPDDPVGAHEWVLQGLHMFFNQDAVVLNMNRAMLIRKLRTVPLASLIRQAVLLRDANRMTHGKAMCEAIRQAYDKGRRSKRSGQTTSPLEPE